MIDDYLNFALTFVEQNYTLNNDEYRSPKNQLPAPKSIP